MTLDPVSLKMFVAVMEEGTIADAAAREHIAASAVSRRLGELEERLRTELFARSNRGVEPTAAAFALLDRARGVLNELDDLYEQMHEYSSGVRGHVRVFANISAITQFLPRELESFLERYPLVQIHLQERISSGIAKALADGAADVGILNDGHYGERIAFLPYHEDELALVVPRGHPLARRRAVSLADALEYDFVGAHPGSFTNTLLTKAASEAGRPLRLRIQVTSYDALCAMVSAGLGVGMLPRGSARLFVDSLGIRCVTLAEPWARRRLMIGVRRLDALSPASRLLVEHLGGSADAVATG